MTRQGLALYTSVVLSLICVYIVSTWIPNTTMEYSHETTSAIFINEKEIRRRQDISYILKDDQQQINNARIPIFTGITTPDCVRKIKAFDNKEELLIPDDKTLQTLDKEVLRCLYERYMRTQQYLCTNTLLLGGVGEGSWFVCDDVKYRNNNPRIAIILTNETQANKFLQYNSNYKFNFQIFVHGTTNSKSHSYVNGRVIISILSDTSSGILQALFRTNHKKRNTEILILDDISSLTYLPFMKHLLDEGYLRKFRQVVLRPPYPLDVNNLWKYLSILRNIYEEGFRIHHMEMNIEPYIPRYTRGHVISYVNKDYEKTQSNGVGDSFPNIEDLDLQKLKDPGEFYYHYLTSPQILCKKIVRTGNIVNGGWEVCHDDAFRPKQPCLIYSFGINYEFSFDDDAARTYGCEIHSFDPSMKGIPQHRRSPLVMFHDVGLADYNGVYRDWTLSTLKTIMKNLGHSNKTIDVLKMDIEWSEHRAIREMLESDSLRHVKQLAWEIHTWRREDADTRYLYELTLLKQLYKYGFRIYWCHINHNLLFDAMDSGKRRSIAMEVHMVNIRFRI